VCDLIRGKTVNQALATLQFTRKIVARELAKVLRSAVANLQQKDGFGGDIDRLYVAEVFANQGMSMKRVRPAPMGRAFRVVKRSAHLTVRVVERPLAIARAGAAGSGASARARKAGGTVKAARGAKKAAATA
jgi:large subunit ribosomal protein L22